jgi:DNA polymerase-1
MATNGKNPNNIIVSDDKDLLTIPTRVYRLGELHDVTVEQADYNWLKQTLTGDVADGYKGCPGIGDKSAAKLLEIPTWETVVKAYTKAGLGQAEALVQARLARILRAEDYVDDAVILWSPNDTVTT